jgi:hypothetical protein
MLVARRDPPFESARADDLRAYGHHPVRHSRLATSLQVIGTLLGIPVGLASAYSVYHANFSDEARCETLRANIVSLLDKSADATTLRMLARRDVIAFETTCGAVDPDAVKAFNHLLAARTAPAPQIAPEAVPDTTPHQTAHETAQMPAPKPVHKPVEVVKQAAPPKPAAAIVESKPVRTDAKTVDTKTSDTKTSDVKIPDTKSSDENWVASVREALIHSPAHEDAAAAISAAPSQPAPPPRVLGTLPTPMAPPAQPALAPTSLAAPPAPTLPAPVAVAAPPAPPPAADHPVPPGAIPEAVLMGKQAEPPSHSWMSKVPILNRVVGN